MSEPMNKDALIREIEQLIVNMRTGSSYSELIFLPGLVKAWANDLERLRDTLSALSSGEGQAPEGSGLEMICRECGAIADVAQRYDPPASGEPPATGGQPSAPAAPVTTSERERLHQIIARCHSLIDPEEFPDLHAEIVAALGPCEGGCVAPTAPPSPSICGRCGDPYLDGRACREAHYSLLCYEATPPTGGQ